MNVTTGPDTRQQSPRVPNAGTEAPAPQAPPGRRPQGRWNPDIEGIVVVACPEKPVMRCVFSGRDDACQNMSRLCSSRRLPSSELLSHSVAIVARAPFIRSPSGMMPWADHNLACCAGMTFRSEGPICGSESFQPSLLRVTCLPAPAPNTWGRPGHQVTFHMGAPSTCRETTRLAVSPRCDDKIPGLAVQQKGR